MSNLLIILGLLISLTYCKKEEGVLMKYAYITKDNIDYKNEKGYEMVTTHLCSYEKPLSIREISKEQTNQKILTEANSKEILADTLVDVNSNVTKILFSKLK